MDEERWPGMPELNPPELEDDPPVEITLQRHVAGDYDAVLGQLCMRCGIVLDGGLVGYAVPEDQDDVAPPRGWAPGEAVMVSVCGGLRVSEVALRADRDRSDEADCESIL